MQHDRSFKFHPAPKRRLSACRQTRRGRLLGQMRTPNRSLSPGLSRKPAAGRPTRAGRTRLIIPLQAAVNCRCPAIPHRRRQCHPRRRPRRQPANRSALNRVRPTLRPRDRLSRRNRRESPKRVVMPPRRPKPWYPHREPASIALPLRPSTARLLRQTQHQPRPIPRRSLPRQPRSLPPQSRLRPSHRPQRP